MSPRFAKRLGQVGVRWLVAANRIQNSKSAAPRGFVIAAGALIRVSQDVLTMVVTASTPIVNGQSIISWPTGSIPLLPDGKATRETTGRPTRRSKSA